MLLTWWISPNTKRTRSLGLSTPFANLLWHCLGWREATDHWWGIHASVTSSGIVNNKHPFPSFQKSFKRLSPSRSLLTPGTNPLSEIRYSGTGLRILHPRGNQESCRRSSWGWGGRGARAGHGGWGGVDEMGFGNFVLLMCFINSCNG